MVYEISIRDAHKGFSYAFNLKYIINRCGIYRFYNLGQGFIGYGFETSNEKN